MVQLGCQIEADGTQNKGEKNNAVREGLGEILEKLKSSKCDREVICSVDTYIKRFEVRKRIYTEYGRDKKPLANAEFEEYEIYLLFADCLLSVCQKKECLKYFSCLLKVDDTLLSVKDKLGEKHRRYLRQIIKQELKIFYQLAEENGIKKEAVK